MKKTIVIIVSIIIIITGIKLSADYYLSNRFSDDVENIVSKAVNAKVSIESISTDILSNISLNTIKINEPQSENTFLTVGSIKCYYTFSQILKKNFIIKDIILEKININIERYSNYTFNFQKFKNYVYNFDIFQGNKIYAADNSSVLPDYLKIEDVNAKKVKVKYSDPLLSESITTGDIDINVNIDPVKITASGKLFEGEQLETDIKRDSEEIYGKISIKDINGKKYIEFYKKYLDSYEITLNSIYFDVASEFIFKDELIHTSEIIIKEFNADYNIFNISMKDEKIRILNRDIIFSQNTVMVSSGGKLLGNIKITGEFRDFKEFRSKIKSEVFKNSILSIFGFKGQDIQIEKSVIEGTLDIPDISSPEIKLSSELKIPGGNYFFFTTDGQKIQFPFSNMNLKAFTIDKQLKFVGKAAILKGSIDVNTVFLDINTLSMENSFILNSISAEEFFKINKLLKIPVYGNLSGNFKMTGKNFDISTFEGKGVVELSKAIFKTMFIDKMLVKTSSQTLRDLPMKNIKADVFLKGEKISFGKITGSGEDVNVNGDGYILLDTSMRFDINMDVLEPFIKKNRLDKILSVEDDFKLEITGTMLEPDVKSNIDDILKEKLKKIIEEQKSEEIDKLKDKAKEFLKKLF